MKVYSDAASGESVSGIGYVVEGRTHVTGKRVIPEPVTSMEAEFYALVEALRIASQRSQSNEWCEAYSDCKPLVKKMRGDERCSDEWRDYYSSCRWLLGKFDEWEIYYCPREQNEDAHELARSALREGRNR